MNALKTDENIETKEFQESVIDVARVARVVKGGRRFRFRALVAVGNGKDQVGVGISKGADVQTAITKAVNVAKKNLITVALEDHTIPHEMVAKVSGSEVMIKPAAPGTGIIAGGTVRAVLELSGIRNILSKLHGSTNKVNVAYATIKALDSLVSKDEWLNTEPAKKPGAPQKTNEKAPSKSGTKKSSSSKEKVKSKSKTSPKAKAKK